ncbi:MFS transporter [Actinoplanes derwentensis]|uniref:Predicted arabinose efflux permease, MFS family n=1 Tax=Actinoplanes derwentensis TaxID=113562 RepID=A0A1H1ZQE4_9ACTN|nr:MFS transporter [Actinoplanes derwentensis]GID89156.1 MFS transporter [Actinoplanes derwentensis]SDT35797.1 Predicted arabinose efflux permease, MFS family [Actinoplanes derwentensis]
MSRLPGAGLFLVRDFRRFFAATVAGQLADRFVFLALPLVAILWLDAGEFEVGVLTAMTTAGSLLIGLPAGAWVDRWRKRPVLIGADLVRAVLLLVVPVAWWADALTIWLLFGVALAHGLATVLFDVGYTSYLPALVGREHLVEGNSKIAAARSAVSVGGPGAAGPLVAWLGAPLTLVASSAGLLLSALGMWGVGKPEPVVEATGDRRLMREIGEGLRFVLGHPLLRPMLFTDGVFSLFLVTYQTMLLVFLSRHVGLGSFGIGLTLSAMAGGGLAGALVARRVITRIGPGPAVCLAPLCTAPAAMFMPMTRAGWPLWLAMAGLALVSMGGVVRLIAQVGLQQTATPDRLLGRMSATVRFVQWGGMPLAGLLGGALGGLLGAPAVLWIGAAGMTAAFLPALLSPLRTTREMPTAVPKPR